MARYVIRRVLWGFLMLIIVAALTFLFFRIIPTGNPAVLRAGRDPQLEEAVRLALEELDADPPAPPRRDLDRRGSLRPRRRAGERVVGESFVRGRDAGRVLRRT